MKIIKTFEDFGEKIGPLLNIKKYVIWELNKLDSDFYENNIYYIILELISHSITKDIKFKKLYFKTPNKIQKYDNEKFAYFSSNEIRKNFIYQTDNLSEALEYVEIYNKSKKYNI